MKNYITVEFVDFFVLYDRLENKNVYSLIYDNGEEKIVKNSIQKLTSLLLMIIPLMIWWPFLNMLIHTGYSLKTI